MGGKSGPEPPDYRGAAEEQSGASKEIAIGQQYAERPDVKTPWGTQSWESSSVVDPTTGKPVTKWNQTIALDPTQQAALDDQMALQAGRSDAALGLLGQATGSLKDPIDTSGLPGRETVAAGQLPTTAFDFGPGIDSGYRQKAQDATWQLQKPMLDERRSDTENKLANMGFARGSEAWDREMRGVDDAENRAMLEAINSGRAEAGLDLGAQQQAFGQGLSEANFGNTAAKDQFGMETSAAGFNTAQREGALKEQQQLRSLPLNELTALLNGQQVQPFSFGGATGGAGGGGATAPNYLQAASQQGNADMQRWMQEQQSNQGYASTAASAAMLAYMYY